MNGDAFIKLLGIAAVVWFIVSIIFALVYVVIWALNGDKISIRNRGLYLALGLFPITSIFGLHILPMCTSTGAKVFHFTFRFLLMASVWMMSATAGCPKGASCAVTIGALFVIPSVALLIMTYLFTVAEAIIAFVNDKK